MLKLTLPDGKTIQLPDKSTGVQAAEAIGKKLAKDALAIEVNGEIRDLSRPIEKDSKIKILTYADKSGKDTLLHSTRLRTRDKKNLPKRKTDNRTTGRRRILL